MRAMVQLPSYLERVLAGGRDLALVLLPLLNDLRAVRGSALLSEGTLLLLNLKSDRQAQPAVSRRGDAAHRRAVGAAACARDFRSASSAGFVASASNRTSRCWRRLRRSSSRSRRASRSFSSGGWSAPCSRPAENGLEGGVSVKRLLGLADREIKRLYESGEAAMP